jgi:hypothetical protein
MPVPRMHLHSTIVAFVRNLSLSPQDMLDECQQMMDMMSNSVQRFELDDFLLEDDCQQVRNGHPTPECPNREYKYKEDHARLFDAIGCTWPAPRSKFSGTLDHMEQRAYEAVVFASEKWPYKSVNGSLPVQFFDANESLTRSCGAEGTTQPWRETLPTLTCSCSYVFRRGKLAEVQPLDDDFADPLIDIEVRQLDGIELLQLVGFDVSYLEGGFPTHSVATSMAGNAFSAFAVGPIALSCLHALGTFKPAAVPSDTED